MALDKLPDSGWYSLKDKIFGFIVSRFSLTWKTLFLKKMPEKKLTEAETAKLKKWAEKALKKVSR